MLLTAIGCYLLLQLAIGFWVGRFIHNESDYFLAGRSLGLGLASISLFATWFGAETMMGSASAIAQEGLAGSRTDPFGYGLCLLLMAWLIAYKMRAGAYVTLGDFFRERFGPHTEKLAVLVFAPTSLLWAAAQLLAFATILGMVAEIPQDIALLGGTCFILFYTILGGMKADVIHDVLQGSVIFLGLAALVWILCADAGGVAAAWQHITPEQLHLRTPGESWLEWLDALAVPVLGSLVAQEALSRLLATRSAAIARKACYLAALIYLTIGSLPAIVGLLGPHIAPQIDSATGDGYLLALASAKLPNFWYVLLAGALVAAILSTIDSTLLSLAALLEHNLISPLLPGETTEKSRVILARICVAGSALAAYLFASGSDKIYSLLEMASSFGSAGILVTVLIGLHHRRFGHHDAAIATLLMGVISSLLGTWLDWPIPYLASLLLCLLTYLLIAGMTHKSERESTSAHL